MKSIRNIISLVAMVMTMVLVSGCSIMPKMGRTAHPAAVSSPSYSSPATAKSPAVSAPATATLPSAGIATVAVNIAASQQSVAFGATNGMVSGVRCLFINKTTENIITTIVSSQGNCIFTLELAPKANREFNITPGQYNCTWTVGDDSTVSGPTVITVDKQPSHFYDGLGSFHGGIIFRGKQ